MISGFPGPCCYKRLSLEQRVKDSVSQRSHYALGAYPPRPRPELLTWVGIGTLQPRTKYLPDMVTWREVWVELGWELSHARAWMRSIEIVYRKEAAMCQLCWVGMRVPLPEPVAHCAGGGPAGESGATSSPRLQPGKVLPVPSAFLPTTGRLVAKGAFSRPPFFLQVSGRGKGAAWVRFVHPSWKGGRYRRHGASRGFPEAIQIVREDGLGRRRNAARGLGFSVCFPSWVDRSPSPAQCCQKLPVGKGRPLESRKGPVQSRWSWPSNSSLKRLHSAWGSAWGKHL